MSGKTKIILYVILALLLGTAGCSESDADIPPALDLLSQAAEDAPEAEEHASETLDEAAESHVEPSPELEAQLTAEEKTPAPFIDAAVSYADVPAAMSAAEPIADPALEPVAEAILEFAAEPAETPVPEPVVTPSPAPTPAPIIGYIDARSLNLREGPSRDSAVAGEFEGGKAVEITGEDGDWYKVRVDGSTGYMLKEYIVQRVPTETEPVAAVQTAAADNFPEKEGYIDAGSLNMRAKPSRDADIIREYSGGQQLKIIGEEGEWYKVTISGVSGYMIKEHVGLGTAPKATAAPSRSTKRDIASSESGEVWVPTNGGKKYHNNPNCSQMIDPAYVTLEKAISLGFTACKRCY